MSNQTNFNAGNSVHSIQARLALADTSTWRRQTIEHIGDGTVTVVDRQGETHKFACADTSRLREVHESGRVPVNSDGIKLVLLASKGVLIIPCADEGKVFSLEAEILANVVYLQDGAALYSPTTDGAWHLFSVSVIDEKTPTL